MRNRTINCIDLLAAVLFLATCGAVAAPPPPGPDRSAESTPSAAATPKKPPTRAPAGDSAGDILGCDYGAAPEKDRADPREEVAEIIRRAIGRPKWTTPPGFVHTEEKNIWTRLREDYNLHGFIQLGIGTDDFWETRTGMAMDLVPGGKVRLGLEAGVGRYYCPPWW